MKNNKIEKAIIHLSKNDKILKSLIKKFDKCNLTPNRKYFNQILQMIIGQQLSTYSAKSIRKRFLSYYQHKPTAKKILQTKDTTFRKLGLSQAKTKYVKELSRAVEENKINLRNISKYNNQQIISELTSVKGIGIWTVHMFLIFVLARLDVLAFSDFGIRKAIMLNFGMEKLPTQYEVKKIAIANNWHPYESVACWYLWKSLDSN